jgi:hypothetical protein
MWCVSYLLEEKDLAIWRLLVVKGKGIRLND